jgi:hypothetical protein
MLTISEDGKKFTENTHLGCAGEIEVTLVYDTYGNIRHIDCPYRNGAACKILSNGHDVFCQVQYSNMRLAKIFG